MIDEDLFFEALERAPDQRAAFLLEACGSDHAKRSRIEGLLRSHEQAGSAFDQPLLAAADTVEYLTTTEEAELDLSKYKLVERIGEGGMGSVWLGQQHAPFKRLVAIKLIKPGMDTRQVLARFEAERQALALMDHPNIAKVLDAGATSAGRPYFVMELVKGKPITKYCDEKKLPINERLALFVQVCQAIQHAHQKGIIHRDLKPSNVMVTCSNGEPAVKVIDFGVAKATGQALTDRTLVTGLGAVLGTPEYMSPEQAELNNLDIDTRSDIYSLGVLLYELLTGSTPITKERVRSEPLLEIFRSIGTEENERPSLRLCANSALSTVADSRGLEPKKLVRMVRGELDWIVMKALDKDRNRRYETANGLALDVIRYLNDAPVQACPPSTGYRFRKFARRNKVAIVTVGLVAVSLLAGTMVSVWQARRAWYAEQDARDRLEGETKARRQADLEAIKANTISNLLQEMLASADPVKGKGAEYTVRQLLDDSSDRLKDQLRDQPELQAALHGVVGNAYSKLNLTDDAEGHLLKALEIRRSLFGPDHIEVAQSILDHSWNLRHRDAKRAEAEAREALAICERHANARETTLSALVLIAFYAGLQQNYPEAFATGERALAFADQHKLRERSDIANLLHNMAQYELEVGDPHKAERLARESVELHLKVDGENHPETAWGLIQHGRALFELGDYTKAEHCFRTAMSVFRRAYDDTFVNEHALKPLRDLLRQKGDLVGLAKLDTEVVERLEKMVERQKGNQKFTAFAARNSFDTGKVYLLAENHPLALKLFEQSVILYESLLDRNPDSTEVKNGYATALAFRGETLKPMKLYPEAEDSFKQAIEVWGELIEQHPNNYWYRQEQAHFSLCLADMLRSLERPAEAMEHCQTSVRLGEGLVAEMPNDATHPFRLAHAYRSHAFAFKQLDQFEQSLTATEGALRVLEKAILDFPNNLSLQNLLTDTRLFACRLLERMGKAEQAYEMYQLVYHQFDISGTSPRVRANLQRSLYALLIEFQRHDEAERLSRESLAYWEAQQSKNRPYWDWELAWFLVIWPDERFRDPARAKKIMERVVQLEPKYAYHWRTLGVAHLRLGDFVAARAALEKACQTGGGGAWEGFFLAIIYWQEGNKGTARDWYDKSTAHLKSIGDFHDVGEALQFQQEAMRVMGIQP